MDRRNEDKTEADVLHNFANLFDETLEEDVEELDAALRAYGYDPHAVAKKMKTVAEQALKESPLNWRNRARQAIDQERARLDSVTGPKEVLGTKLREIVVGLMAQVQQLHGQEAVAHFRNLEEVKDEDLADIAAELQHLLSEDNPTEED